MDFLMHSSTMPTTFPYDTTTLVSGKYIFRWCLDKENPDFQEVCTKYDQEKIDYKIMERNERQRDIWVKG